MLHFCNIMLSRDQNMSKKKNKKSARSNNKTGRASPNSGQKAKSPAHNNNLSVSEYTKREELLTLETAIKLRNKRNRSMEYFKTWIFYSVALLVLLILLLTLVLMVIFFVKFFLGNEKADRILSFIQLITGLASLGIGIWGIFTAFRTKGSSNRINQSSVINQTPVNPDVKGMLGEPDINQDSI